MPRTYAGLYQRSRTGRFLYGRVTDCRLRRIMASVPNTVQRVTIAPTNGEAPLDVNATVPAKQATTIVMVGNRASFPAEPGVTGGGAALSPLQGGAAFNTDNTFGGVANAAFARRDNPATLNGGGVVTLDWGDASPDEVAAFNSVTPHTYALEGEYDATVAISDNIGRVNTISIASVEATSATAPVFTAPPSATALSRTILVDATINENGDLYAIVLANGAAAPTSAAVKAGTGDLSDTNDSPVTVLANVAGTITLDGSAGGLVPATAYDVYVVAEDTVGNLQAAPTKIDITTGAPPVFTVAPAASSITNTTFDIDATVDQDGALYAIVLADGALPPTSADVKAGTGDLAATNSSPAAVVAAVAGQISLTGLTAATAYDVYVVAEDAYGSLQLAPTKVDVTTLP